MRNVNFLKSMDDTRLFFGYKRIIRCVLIPSLSKESFHSNVVLSENLTRVCLNLKEIFVTNC